MKMASSSTTLAVISGCRGPSSPPQEPLRVSGPLCFPESHTSLTVKLGFGQEPCWCS